MNPKSSSFADKAGRAAPRAVVRAKAEALGVAREKVTPQAAEAKEARVDPHMVEERAVVPGDPALPGKAGAAMELAMALARVLMGVNSRAPHGAVVDPSEHYEETVAAYFLLHDRW